MILLPILKKNESYEEMIAKLHEEVKELTDAVTDYRVTGNIEIRDHMLTEVMDVIQVCAGILNQAQKDGADLEQLGHKHLLKLANRHQFVFEGFYQLKRLD